MSLIQEALRRRDEEAGGGPGKIPPRVVLPVTDAERPTQPPSTDVLPAVRMRTRFWGILTTLLAVALVVAVSVLGWFFYRFAPILKTSRDSLAVSNRMPSLVELTQADRLEKPRVIAPAEVPEEPTRAAAATPHSQAHPRPESLVPERAPEDQIKSMSPVSAVPDSAPVASAEQLRGGDGAAATETTVVAAVGGGTTTVGSAVTMRSVAIPAKTSVWPRLTLNGVMAQTGLGQGSAIVNGTVVEIGEKIEGARLLEVRRTGVLLEFKGNTQFLRVGQSTY